MNNYKKNNAIKIILLPIMILYTMLPCVTEAGNIIDVQTTKAITYFYSGSALTNEADGNGNMSTYLGSTIRTIINTSTDKIAESSININDGKSVVAQTDTSGSNIDNTYEYTPYGVPSSSLKTLNLKPKTSADVLNIWQNPFQYDSYYYDQESGLEYLQSRYYSPILMHFISMDTYDLANRYAYCNGNPVANEDPTGHMSGLALLQEWAKAFVKKYLNPIDMTTSGDVDLSPIAIMDDVFNISSLVYAPEENILKKSLANLAEDKEVKANIQREFINEFKNLEDGGLIGRGTGTIIIKKSSFPEMVIKKVDHNTNYYDKKAGDLYKDLNLNFEGEENFHNEYMFLWNKEYDNGKLALSALYVDNTLEMPYYGPTVRDVKEKFKDHGEDGGALLDEAVSLFKEKNSNILGKLGVKKWTDCHEDNLTVNLQKSDFANDKFYIQRIDFDSATHC